MRGDPGPILDGSESMELAAFLFSYYMVPETKGRSLEQIPEWYSAGM